MNAAVEFGMGMPAKIGRCLLGVTLATVLAALAPAHAEQFVSYRYDGTYVGGATLVPDLSDSACSVPPLHRLMIINGTLRAYDAAERQVVKGIITGNGFFNASYYQWDGTAALFEGSVDKAGSLTGGIFDGDCVWLVEMYRV